MLLVSSGVRNNHQAQLFFSVLCFNLCTILNALEVSVMVTKSSENIRVVSIIHHFLLNPDRILRVLTFNRTLPLNVNGGRKLQIIEKLDYQIVQRCYLFIYFFFVTETGQ